MERHHSVRNTKFISEWRLRCNSIGGISWTSPTCRIISISSCTNYGTRVEAATDTNSVGPEAINCGSSPMPLSFPCGSCVLFHVCWSQWRPWWQMTLMWLAHTIFIFLAMGTRYPRAMWVNKVMSDDMQNNSLPSVLMFHLLPPGKHGATS